MKLRGAQPQSQQQPQTRRRTNCTEEMNSVLLECRKKAKLMVEMRGSAVMVGGRRKGYIEFMKELFDQAGYEHFTRQNLGDQAAHLEKLLGNVTGNVSSKVGRRRRNELESLKEGKETCDSTQVLDDEIRALSPSRCMNLLTRKLSGISKSTRSTLSYVPTG